MKKFLVLILGTAFLFSSGSVSAKEEPISPPVALTSVSTESTGFPFKFSVTPGKWTQAETGKIFSTGYQSPDFTLPSLKETPAPIRYPRWAIREGWEGNFSIAIEVLPTGQVGRSKVMESTGYPLLDEVAVKAVQGWVFHPATEKGKAVVSCIQIPIRFELKN